MVSQPDETMWTLSPDSLPPRKEHRRSGSVGAARASYRGLIVDLDGVVWRGGDPIPRAVGAIRVLRDRGVKLVFVTNDPSRTRRAIAQRLAALGAPTGEEEILTAASATARMVARLNPPARRALLIGPAALGEEFAAAGIEACGHDSIDDAADVVVVAGHDGFEFSELRRATTLLRAGARLFATGRDAVYPTAKGLSPATGAVLAAVEVAGGVRATVAGKPEPMLFNLARAALEGYEPVAMVGDNLLADVVGAKRAGLPAVLTLSGVSERADLQEAEVPPDLVVDDLMSLALLDGGDEECP